MAIQSRTKPKVFCFPTSFWGVLNSLCCAYLPSLVQSTSTEKVRESFICSTSIRLALTWYSWISFLEHRTAVQEDKHYYYFHTGIPVISSLYGKHIYTGFCGITYIESRHRCSTETNLGAWVTRFPGRAQLCSSLSSQNKAVPELSHVRHLKDLTNLATEWKLQVSVTTNSRFHCYVPQKEQSTEPQQHCNSASQIHGTGTRHWGRLQSHRTAKVI